MTEPRDKAALLAFKASVIDNGLMLAGWDEYTDPCIDQWRGVLCTCLTEYEDEAGNRIPACTPMYNTSDYSRVLQLNLGDVRIRQWNVLQGNLSASLGDLSALRILNLKNNNLTGPIPWQWTYLTNLEQLVLAENNITGPLPIFFSRFKRLKYVFLERNQLSGPVPIDWCYGAYWAFDVRFNPGLCDELPDCLYDRLTSFEGTSLVDTVGDRDLGQGGYCGVAPPTCRRNEDACWVQTPDSNFWTDSTNITFSFPDFRTYEGGMPAGYTWRLGTQPGAGDVSDWQVFTGRNVTQTAELWDETISGDATKPSIITQTVHIADGALPEGVALRQGGQYYVTVRGTNAAGPLNAVQVISDPVSVDNTPPELPPGSAVYSSQYFSNALAQTDTYGIGVSWDPFEDPESGIRQYSYQVFEYVPRRDTSGGDGAVDYTGDAQTGKIKTKDINSRGEYITKLNLNAGKSYFVRVYATNGAGKETYRDGPPVAVMNPGEALVVNNNIEGLAVSKVVVVVATLVGAVAAAVAVLTFYFARERYRRRQQKSRKYRGQMRNFRTMLNSLVERVGTADKADPLDELRKLKNVAFVITDLEGSTKIAAAAPSAYEWVQEAHDALLRDLIAVYGGYEINTEGDAFHVAFKDVSTAVHFCMEVQYQMMEVEWPREVLKLPECKEVKAPDDAGSWAYRGPRVRMGIHWAEEGSVVQHIHALTKHRVFTGPAFQITRELCEAGKGGQVLLTHDVWERLRGAMPAAAFPVVEQLGCFKFPSFHEGIWVYQVTRLLGKPLYRSSYSLGLGGQGGGGEGGAVALQGVEMIEDGGGLSIVGAPTPRSSKGDLVFVSCRLALECCPGADADTGISQGLHSRLYNVLAASAMQYSGFIFRMSESQGCYLVAFGSTVDAVRFCHTAQVLLMYCPWPAAECGDYCGEEERAPDGKVLFNGPRIAMAIHESNDYSTRPVPRPCASPDGADTHFADYLGPAEEAARVLSEVAHGGQVVLSEPAWKAVQDQLPGQPQVISLGTHALTDPVLPGPTMLMEVMPQVLAKRSFPPPQKGQMVEPGYRDAPSAATDVAIAQVRVVKPDAVAAAEAAGAGLTDATIIRIITAYNVALARAVRAARLLLRTHDGYECKEPEPGKLTVAFRSLESALRWAAALQSSLLEVHWPREILSWEECREVREGEEEDDFGYGHDDGLEDNQEGHGSAEILKGVDGTCGDLGSIAVSGISAGGAVVWRGLKVRIGIACGIPTSKAPLNTGRADNFGTIPNLAARLMSLAQSGQVLFDGAKLPTLRPLNPITWRDEVGILPGNELNPEGIELTPLGQFQIKGLEDLRSVFQALPVGLMSRTFAESPALVRPSGPSMSRRSTAARVNSMKMLDNSNNGVAVDKSMASSEHAGTALASSSMAAPAAAAVAQRSRPNIFSSISRTGSVTGTNASGKRGTGYVGGSGLFRSISRAASETSDGGATLVVPSQVRSSAMTSISGTSSGGGATGNWVARSLLFRGSNKSGGSAVGSPRSPHGGGPFVSVPIPLATGFFHLGDGITPRENSATTGGVSANGGAQGGGTNNASVPKSYTSLRDVADWSCPGSRIETPTGLSATDVIDPWDEGFAMEAAFKVDGLDLANRRSGGAGEVGSGGLNSSSNALDGDTTDPFGSMILDGAEGGGGGYRRSTSSKDAGGWVDQAPAAATLTPRLKIQTLPSQKDLGGSLGHNGESATGESKGLQFAQQVAQLFVDRRKKSGGDFGSSVDKSYSNDSGRSGSGGLIDTHAISGTSPTKTKTTGWLVGKLRGGSKDPTPVQSPSKMKRTGSRDINGV
ncbi:putative Adenylate cyclase [Nannochloris sp. 'desiccata']|nr:putative Adenylate cyclase [Chlorella desiccata (nom. nud.)]